MENPFFDITISKILYAPQIYNCNELPVLRFLITVFYQLHVHEMKEVAL